MNESEHKRQEALHHNMELLVKLKQKDAEIVVLTSRLNQLKSKKAKFVLKDEYEELQHKFQQAEKKIANSKKAEQNLRELCSKEKSDVEAKWQAIVDGMKNERLGFLNQIHSLKQLTDEMRTETVDLRQ